MPEWEHCAKIHEGCGGVIRWVEAVDRPGVGYHGECLVCGAVALPVEDMVLLEQLAPEDAMGMGPDDLADLEWDDDADFEANQERLHSEVFA